MGHLLFCYHIIFSFSYLLDNPLPSLRGVFFHEMYHELFIISYLHNISFCELNRIMTIITKAIEHILNSHLHETVKFSPGFISHLVMEIEHELNKVGIFEKKSD